MARVSAPIGISWFPVFVETIVFAETPGRTNSHPDVEEAGEGAFFTDTRLLTLDHINIVEAGTLLIRPCVEAFRVVHVLLDDLVFGVQGLLFCTPL